MGFLLMVPMFNKAAELCIPYFNALLGNVIPHSTLFITIIFCALAPLGLFRGPFTLYGCGAATLGILKGIGFSTAFLAPLIYDGHERFLLYHAVLDRMGNQLCQGFYQGFLKDERRMRLDHLRDLTDCHICDVWLTKRSKLSWEKD